MPQPPQYELFAIEIFFEITRIHIHCVWPSVDAIYQNRPEEAPTVVGCVGDGRLTTTSNRLALQN